MSLYEEAWKSFLREIENERGLFDTKYIKALMAQHLQEARQKVKKYQGELARELGEESKKYE